MKNEATILITDDLPISGDNQDESDEFVGCC
jgi:hypothetical protein